MMAKFIATKAKAALGSLLAGSVLLTAVPANAQYRGDRHDRRHDGISAGEVIAGAVVLGGLAAVLASSNNNRDERYYDRGGDRYRDGYHGGYDHARYGGARAAVERCVAAVERQGSRRADIDVTRVSDVDRIRGGYRITGQVAADYRNYGYRDGGPSRWNRDGDGRSGRGYNPRQDYDDRGRFSCVVQFGRVQDVNIRGI